MDGKITYHQQVSFCGKPRCRRCQEGIGHGPYWYAYQTVNGRTVRTYVGKQPPAEYLAAQAETSEIPSSEFANTLLRFHTLGQFRLEVRGEGQENGGPRWEGVADPSLQHQRVRALLSCLASSPGRKLAREQVMYMLWPELDVETASHRLDRAVHSLRQVFEPGRSRPATSRLLLTEHSTLSLAEQEYFWIDADAFEGLVARARASSDPGETEQLLGEAVQLYSGDFMLEEAQIEYVQNRRESLRRGWISLLLELADLRIAREAMPVAIDTLDRLLGVDPTNEAAVQRLVVLLAQMGRRGEAIQAYQRFASVLKEDYKIAPLPETQTIYETVLRGNDIDLPRARGAQFPPTVAFELSPASTPLPVGQPSHMHIGRTHQSPLIGRDDEVARLNQLLHFTEQTRRLRVSGQKKSTMLAPPTMDIQRHSQCVLLMGDVGIGKTRLAEEAAREAKRRNWAVAWCRAYVQESNVPYRLWTETLRKAMTQGLWQRQEVTRRPLIYQPLRSLLPELQDLLPQSLQGMPQPPEQEQLRLWESTRALLGTICENTTLLVVLDDVQWADSSSCELLTYLVRQMRGQPVMFLCTCRDIELPNGHPLRAMLTDLQREQAIQTLPVTPLSDEQIRALVSHLPAQVGERISSRASGNPFFAEELARGIAAGDIEAVLDPVNAPPLPDTISAVLELRLGRITQQCHRLLERGAVLGGEFQFDSISAMASGGALADEDMILDLLEEALQAGMLTEEGNGMQITYHFWHPLLMTYLYEHLSAARRASLHRRAAQVLQIIYAGREAEGAAEITNHLVNGGSERGQIARYAELAADRAYSLSAYPSAEKHYRLALQYLPNLTPAASQDERLHRAYILERLGESMIILGKFEDARNFYEQVLDLRSKQRVFASEDERKYEAQIEALIWCEISRAWRYLGDSVKSNESLQKGENVLSEAGVDAGPAWAKIRYQQGHTLWLEGNLAEALVMANEALGRFEVLPTRFQGSNSSPSLTQAQRTLNGDAVGLGRVYTLMAGVEITIGKSTDALNHLQQALSVFEQNDIKNEVANVCCNLADVYLRRSEYALARPLLMRSQELAEAVGHRPIMSVALVNLGVISARLGNLVEGEIWYRRALTITEQVNDLFFISLFHSYVAMALIDQGKLDEAEPLLVQALKVSRSRHIAPCTGFALVALGHLRLARALMYEAQKRNSPNAQRRRSKENLEHLLLKARSTLQRALTCEGLEIDAMLDGRLVLSRIALLLGETKDAYAHARQALDDAFACEQVWLQARAQCLLGHASMLLKQFAEAEEYFRLALHTFENTGMRLEHARTLQAYGMAFQQTTKDSACLQQALKYLRDAQSIFQECHAAIDLQYVERVLAHQNTSVGSSAVGTRKVVRKAP